MAKKRPIIRMHELAASTDATRDIEVIDLKDRQYFTQRPHLSNQLIQAIEKTILNKEQVLLFLNRRGTARVVFCEHCGWQAICPHCDIPLIYHADKHRMLCHSCSYHQAAPSSCPDCGNTSIIFKSIGTKAVADEVASLFPDVKLQRFDSDNKRSEKIEKYYNALRNGEIEILVGTQTLAKGLDLPRLGLVGVVIADTSLYFPDFSTQERTFQLLSQVVGRVGRGHRYSRAIIQTFNPDSSLLKAAIHQDWAAFYENELIERQRFLFPPFCYLLKLSCRRASSASAKRTADSLAQKLQAQDLRIIVEGPSPSFHEKIQDKYQWQIVVKSKNRSELLKIIKQLPSGWSYDIDPMNLL